MRVKKGFTLRTICGESILLAEGKENIDFSDIISMNPTAVYLWKSVQDKDFTAKDLARLLTDQYEVDEATALEDANELAGQWKKAGIVED